MKTIDFSASVLHDSTKDYFRSPMGAVLTGGVVTIRLKIRDFYYKRVYLTVIKGKFRMDIEMHRGDDGVLYAEYDTPAEPCVLWYFFTIRLDDNNKIYYGPPAGVQCGVGKIYWSVPPSYQLTVYDRKFKTPNWFKGTNMYQIFPDRFSCGNKEKMLQGMEYHKEKNRHFDLHETWDEMPRYRPVDGAQFYQPCDFFGGDLEGIKNSLDYFEEMGIGVLYLNPVFEAASNHRYNTGDYLNIDPILGTNEDFISLTKEAKKRGIKIMLDGVFSHTGDDSVYFNKYGSYSSVGAMQSKDSKYYDWFKFDDYPHTYKSWWGFETLPEVDEEKPEWVNFIIKNKDSVINTWLNRGASGYRLDVADELPDKTIEEMRNTLKKNDSENVLLGEVWEDATTKQSYGSNRTYALGKGLDSVMNYPFSEATIGFILGYRDSYSYKHFLMGQSQNYPKEMYYSLMNLLSSHDVARVRTLLGTRIDAHSLTREQQAHFVVTEEQNIVGARLQKIAVAIQFSIPGVPSIYYGDETGMNGLLDPFNRNPFRVIDTDMQEYHKKFAMLRKQNDALKTGHCVFYTHTKNTISIFRFCIDGKDAFSNKAKDGAFVTLVNCSKKAKRIVVDLFAHEQLYEDWQREYFASVRIKEKCYGHIRDKHYKVSNGLISVKLPPQSAEIVEVKWK